MNALLNITLPVFGIIFCGYLAARLKILGPQSSEALNAFVYYFALPAILFVFVARAPVRPSSAFSTGRFWPPGAEVLRSLSESWRWYPVYITGTASRS